MTKSRGIGRGHRKPDKIRTLFEYEMVGYSTPCWMWKRRISTMGYGMLTRKHKSLYAHRWMYEMANGPIQKGMYIDHLCRNRACCRPDHLEVVTNQVNSLRGNGSKLTTEDVLEIRRLRKEGIAGAELARKYGVTRVHISRIHTGKVCNYGN